MAGLYTEMGGMVYRPTWNWSLPF